MGASDRLLSLRPTNAVASLSGAALPVLDPRELILALPDGVAMLCVPVGSEAALPGLFRAARDLEAIVGFSAPYAPNERESAYRFFHAVKQAAQEVRRLGPFFLQAGPIRIARADARALEPLLQATFRIVDAGFTLLSLDGSRLAPDEAAHCIAELASPALERELSVEVAAPRDEEGRTSAGAARALLGELAKCGIVPRFLRLTSRAVSGEAFLDFDLVREIAAAAEAHGASLSLEDLGGTLAERARDWVQAGVRKYEPAAAFGRIALSHLSGEHQMALQARADGAGLPVTDVLALAAPALQPPAPESRERIEALSFAEAHAWLESLGAVGSARAVASFYSGGAEA